MAQHKQDSNESKKTSLGKTDVNETDSRNTEKENQIETTHKELTVGEILGMMNANTKQFQILRTEITDHELEINDLKNKRAHLQTQIKPIKRVTKKFNPNGVEFLVVPPPEKKGIRHEIKVIKNQIILKEDQLSQKKYSYDKYSKAIEEEMQASELRNKAQSKYWTKRNKWSIEIRVIKMLNNLRTERKKDIRELAKLSMSKTMVGIANFEKVLQKTMDDFDIETSILCSHELRSVMYENIRLTLRKWNSKTAPMFEKLIISTER